MAALDFARTTDGSTGLVGRIGSVLNIITAKIVEWNDERETRNALSELSDRELEDIGLCRGDIDLIATGKHPF